MFFIIIPIGVVLFFIIAFLLLLPVLLITVLRFTAVVGVVVYLLMSTIGVLSMDVNCGKSIKYVPFINIVSFVLILKAFALIKDYHDKATGISFAEYTTQDFLLYIWCIIALGIIAVISGIIVSMSDGGCEKLQNKLFGQVTLGISLIIFVCFFITKMWFVGDEYNNFIRQAAEERSILYSSSIIANQDIYLYKNDAMDAKKNELLGTYPKGTIFSKDVKSMTNLRSVKWKYNIKKLTDENGKEITMLGKYSAPDGNSGYLVCEGHRDNLFSANELYTNSNFPNIKYKVCYQLYEKFDGYDFITFQYTPRVKESKSLIP